MATSAVLVLPSMLESFGAVLIEALACGTPVVSTRCGGPEDIVVDEVGRLVPVGDALALSRAVEDVLEDPHRYPVERLRHYALSHFSWDIVAERILSVYRGVLKGRSP
jgi:glycosyltransferase involved in cell wall biosynthesis